MKPARRMHAPTRRLAGLLAVVGLVLGGAGCAARGPASDLGVPAPAAANLNGVLWMQHGAGYRAAALQAYALAEQAMRRALKDDTLTAALEQQPGEAVGLAPAVILDVDETVLDNSPYEARRIRAGESFSPETWAAWVREAAARPVPGALAFTRTADSLGVEVFYVTNRDHELEAPTGRNLRRLGFPLDTATDHLLTEGERPAWGSDKSSRRDWVAREHRILVLVGDDLNDFVDARESAEAYRGALETHRDRFGVTWFMLPNPSYGSWERAFSGFTAGLTPGETFRRKLESLETATGTTADRRTAEGEREDGDPTAPRDGGDA